MRELGFKLQCLRLELGAQVRAVREYSDCTQNGGEKGGTLRSLRLRTWNNASAVGRIDK